MSSSFLTQESRSLKNQGLRHKKTGTEDNFVLSSNPHSYVSGNFTITLHISTDHFVVLLSYSDYFSSLHRPSACDGKNKEKHPCHQNMLYRVRINASIGSSGSGPVIPIFFLVKTSLNKCTNENVQMI